MKCRGLLQSIFLANQNAETLILEAQKQFFLDRKSTRLNSSHTVISYAVFCLKKKIKNHTIHQLHSYSLSQASL